MNVDQVKSCETYFKFDDLVRDTVLCIGRKLVVGSSNQSHYQYFVWIPEDISFVPTELTYWSLNGLSFLMNTSAFPALFSSRKAKKRYTSYVKALQK